jgi:hypothetical protein
MHYIHDYNYTLLIAELTRKFRRLGAKAVYIPIFAIFMIISLVILLRYVPQHKEQMQKSPLDDSDDAYDHTTFVEREWPLAPPFTAIPLDTVRVRKKSLLNLIATNAARGDAHARACVMPASYGLPWDILYIGARNITYINAQWSAAPGTPRSLVFVTSHKGALRGELFYSSGQIAAPALYDHAAQKFSMFAEFMPNIDAVTDSAVAFCIQTYVTK